MLRTVVRSRTLRATRRGFIRAAALLAVVAALAAPGLAPARATASWAGIPYFSHFFYIMMENTSYDSLIGNANAPWINQAAKTYGVATNYHGATHPSQPNYVAATSGATNGVTDDSHQNINAVNLVDQLEANGITWKAYMQSLGAASPLADTANSGLYGRKHDPFASYTDIQDNPSRLANIVDFSQFSADLANGTAPQFAWITPDECHDMHGHAGATPSDPCDYSQIQALISAGDSFLQSTVKEIMSSSAWTTGSYIVITWDESDFPFGDTSGCCDGTPGGGQVLTLVIAHDNTTPRTSNTPYNHYSILATIEAGWHLGCLARTCDYGPVVPMTDLFS